MHREGLVWLDDVHLELKVDGAAASQRDSMTNTGDRKEYRDVISIFLLWFNTDRRKEAWLVVRKNPKRRAIPQANRKSSCTVHAHTFVQAGRLGGRCEGGCAGHWWQGKHALELTASPPPKEERTCVKRRERVKDTGEECGGRKTVTKPLNIKERGFHQH